MKTQLQSLPPLSRNSAMVTHQTTPVENMPVNAILSAGAETPRCEPPLLAFWVGTTDHPELSIALDWLKAHVTILTFKTPEDVYEARLSHDRMPTLCLLACEHAGMWLEKDVALIVSSWPLTPVVSVLGSLADGKRRSGPMLGGVDDLFWYDVAGRVGEWLEQLNHNQPGVYGIATTSRREERLLSSLSLGRYKLFHGLPRVSSIAVVARRSIDLDGLIDLVKATGREAVSFLGDHPPLDESFDIILWDLEDIRATDLAWLELLSANMPHALIVLLESFPRGHSSERTRRAGAAAVLSRPVALDVLNGVLDSLETNLHRNHLHNP